MAPNNTSAGDRKRKLIDDLDTEHKKVKTLLGQSNSSNDPAQSAEGDKYSTTKLPPFWNTNLYLAGLSDDQAHAVAHMRQIMGNGMSSALLPDDVGAGKIGMALSFVMESGKDDGTDKPVLVLCQSNETRAAWKAKATELFENGLKVCDWDNAGRRRGQG